MSRRPPVPPGHAAREGIVHVDDYGVRPRDAKRRARTVVAVSRSPAVPGRPMLWCAAFGTIAIAALALVVVALLQQGLDAFRDPAVLVLFVPVFVGSTWGFCYGWELFDAGRATRLAFVLAVSGLALVIVVALALLVVAALSKDADIDLDLPDVGGAIRGFVGAIPEGAVETAGDVGLAALEAVYAEMPPPWAPSDPVIAAAGSGAVTSAAGAGVGPLPPPLDPDDPRGLDCPACGFRFDATDRLACPSCGRPV